MEYGLHPVRKSGSRTFNGIGPAYGEILTITLKKNGVLDSISNMVAYYLLDPVVPLGKSSYYGSTPWGIVTSSFPLPAMVTVGNTGDFYILTYYHDLTMSTVDAFETSTYSIAANNSTTLLFCLNSTISDVTAQGSLDGLANGTESDCYTIDAAGTVELASIAMTINGVRLNFN